MLFLVLHQLFGVHSMASIHTPCDKDVEVLCSGIRPGEARIGRCLKSQRAQVSSECTAYANKIQARRVALKQACYEDIKAVCVQSVPGHDRVYNCLQQSPQVSAKCKAELLKFDDMIQPGSR